MPHITHACSSSGLTCLVLMSVDISCCCLHFSRRPKVQTAGPRREHEFRFQPCQAVSGMRRAWESYHKSVRLLFLPLASSDSSLHREHSSTEVVHFATCT
ncbi:hypothetical protein FKM82_020610 [Ascaphus truei]